MSMTNYTKSQSNGIVNHAVGHIVTDAVAAAAQTINPGFLPRKIHFVNLTDRITDDWFENMAEDNLQDAIRGITAHLDADTGVADTNYAALWGNPVPVASNPNSPPDPATVQATVQGLQAALAGITLKLDADATPTDNDYYSLWGKPAATLTALKAAITGLALKLDNDTAVNSTDYTSGFVTSKLSTVISLHSVVAGDKTLELTNGIAVDVDPRSATYGSFTLTATTMVASKSFYWEAIG